MNWTFDTPQRVQLVVENEVGSVLVATSEGDITTVILEADTAAAEELVERATVECVPFGGRYVVRVKVPRRSGAKFMWRSGASVSAQVAVPPGSDVEVSVASASVDLTGDFGDLSLKSASGDIDADGRATGATIKTASADVSIGNISGPVRMQSASGDLRASGVEGALTVITVSGDVEIGAVGDRLDVRSTSGNVRLGQVSGDATVGSVSGDVRVIAYGRGRMQVRSVSGNVAVGIPPGVALAIDAETVSGTLDSAIPLTEGSQAGRRDAVVSIRARSVSGDIIIERAADSLVA
jgi:DUF4097 and DUF4098 domain-containing protein YvlB